jgi:hypothetical protein
MTKTRMAIGATFAAALLVAAAAPAGAQPRQEGLVNVFADDVTVLIPIAVAANVCGVAVNVLATAANTGDVDCTAEGVAIAEDDGRDGRAPNQRGLVNVALVDVFVAVPVSVAANICGVTVNVLAESLNQGSVDCEALADSNA